MSHDNRNWKRNWTIDVGTRRATHVNGLVLLFPGKAADAAPNVEQLPDTGVPGEWSNVPELMKQAQRLFPLAIDAGGWPKPSLPHFVRHDEWLTVGQIRAVIEGRADDEQVMGQVVAGDGTAWQMRATIAPAFGCDRGVIVCLTHPDLESMVDDDRPLSSFRFR